MIYIHIDNPETKKIVGYECGNRADFDIRHPSDPLWIFLDHDVVNLRVDTEKFFQDPTQYYLDEIGLLQKIEIILDPEDEVFDFVYLTDSTGSILTDVDGAYLTEPV